MEFGTSATVLNRGLRTSRLPEEGTRPDAIRTAWFTFILLLACVAPCVGIAFSRGVTISVPDAAGVLVLLELVLLALMAVVPVAWRLSMLGWIAMPEPLCLISASFLLYYVFRGFLLLFRNPLDHDGLIFL